MIREPIMRTASQRTNRAFKTTSNSLHIHSLYIYIHLESPFFASFIFELFRSFTNVVVVVFFSSALLFSCACSCARSNWKVFLVHCVRRCKLRTDSSKNHDCPAPRLLGNSTQPQPTASDRALNKVRWQSGHTSRWHSNIAVLFGSHPEWQPNDVIFCTGRQWF